MSSRAERYLVELLFPRELKSGLTDSNRVEGLPNNNRGLNNSEVLKQTPTSRLLVAKIPSFRPVATRSHQNSKET